LHKIIAATPDFLFFSQTAPMGISNDIHQGKFRNEKNKAMVKPSVYLWLDDGAN
jgi:hypothetical protein